MLLFWRQATFFLFFFLPMVFLFDVMVTCLFWELLPWATLSVTTLVQRIVQTLSTIYSIPTGSGFPNTHTHTLPELGNLLGGTFRSLHGALGFNPKFERQMKMQAVLLPSPITCLTPRRVVGSLGSPSHPKSSLQIKAGEKQA